MEAPKNQKGVGLKSGGMRSAWKGIQTVTDVPPKRSNSGQATVGGVEESVFATDLNSFYNRPRSWELRTQKLKSHLVRTQSFNVLSLKPGVGQLQPYMLRSLPEISSLLISTLPVHSPAFFPKSLPIFPALAVANTWFLCRPAD